MARNNVVWTITDAHETRDAKRMRLTTPQERLSRWESLEGGETRFLKIMRALLSGAPRERLAREFDADLATIAVYEKALHGRLSRGSFTANDAAHQSREDHRKLIDRIIELRRQGREPAEIAQLLGIKYPTVLNNIHRYLETHPEEYDELHVFRGRRT